MTVKKAKMLFYYYMLRDDVKAGELAALSSLPEKKTEVWTELNLTELMLTNDALVLEDAAEDFGDPADEAFLKENGICQIYAVSFDERDTDEAMKILKKFVSEKGGFVCSDTEDLKPIILGQ